MPLRRQRVKLYGCHWL